jgi:DNA-binding CsgD family transcriptional regulator
MTKKAEKRPGTQGGNGTDTELATALAPLVAGMTATRASLLDWVHGRGVVALQEVFAAAGSGDAAIGTQGIALPLRAADGACYVAHVLPLTSGARHIAGLAYAATAAMFIRRAALDTLSPPEVIARTYKLTPTELNVLLAIVEIGGVPEVAAALGVAETTIKTHVGRLFEKTGAGRQADLVKVVAGFSTPLVA